VGLKGRPLFIALSGLKCLAPPEKRLYRPLRAPSVVPGC